MVCATVRNWDIRNLWVTIYDLSDGSTKWDRVFLKTEEALQKLREGTIDAVAGLRDALSRRASQVPNSRLLSDNITRAQQAIALPKAHTAALAYMTAYLVQIKQSGLVAAAIQRTGVVGGAVAP